MQQITDPGETTVRYIILALLPLKHDAATKKQYTQEAFLSIKNICFGRWIKNNHNFTLKCVAYLDLCAVNFID